MSYIKDLRKYVGHNPILTAGVGLFVFNDKDEVLMQLRTDYNQYGFPGGAMELGESFEDVARRELKDTYREYPNGDKLYDITAIFVVKKYSGELRVNDNKSKKLEWFNVCNLPSNMTEHTKNYLEKYGDILGVALKMYKDNFK